jgi:PhzF family phenazine biosynthesis protein
LSLGVELYDAFSDRLFGGNVAGVVVEARGLSAEEMQRVASELGAPTTGFVVSAEPGETPSFEVRYFTPLQEIDLCGHVTVALFTALAAEGLCPAQTGGAPAVLRTAAGESNVLVYAEDDGRVTVEMGQRLPEHEPSAVAVEEVRAVLGGVALHPGLPVEVASTGLRHLMVPFSRVEDLGELRPDFSSLAELGRAVGIDTVCAFVPGDDGRVRMRDFCSPIGADEEPASGTTSGALACYLHRHGLAPQTGRIVVQVEMGIEMGRPSRVEARLEASDGAVERVSVLGRAVRSLKGEMELTSYSGKRVQVA